MPPKKKAAGDAAKGEKIFKNLCLQCHEFGKNGSQGPDLKGVIGRFPGTLPGFAYSQPMKDMSGTKWTEKTIDKYIKSPADYVPGKLF